MKAVVCQNAELSVREIEEPRPAAGQVLLQVLRCGICGSDLHVRQHCNVFGRLIGRAGYRTFPDASEPMVFGHEFCGEVLEHGPGTPRGMRAGTRVCALPFLRQGRDIDCIGLSSRSHGAYAERIVVEHAMMVPVPNGLPTPLAALTEPMAVGLHAVNRSEIRKSDVAIVVGCGPVGLAVICMLKARGVRTVIASDFSAGRRQLAAQCGADTVLNPADDSPFSRWEEYGFLGGLPDLLELAVGTREKLGRLPLPWWQSWRLAEALGLAPKRPVVFECVGMPGVLNHLIDGAPLFTRVVVVGVCMQTDQIEPAMGNNKEIDLRFVMGYSPLEYRDALHLMAEGRVRCAHLVTATVGLHEVADAFDALADPERHAKILIDPQRPTCSLQAPLRLNEVA